MSKITFKPLKIRRLSEIIENSIKDSILTSALKPGYKLPNERQIANQFGVSVITVREALRGLEAYGIIYKRRGREGGIFVGPENGNDGISKNTMENLLISGKYSAKDIGDVRKIIEPAIARIAASTITEQGLKALEKNLKYCENLVKRMTPGTQARVLLDIKEAHLEFHRLIAEATHNSVLSLIVDYTEDFLLTLNKTMLYGIDHNIEVIRQHREIYDELVKRNPERTELLMLRHCEFVDKYDRIAEQTKAAKKAREKAPTSRK
jgi:GntR family transcriptional regulator, transcriptional repressor for pyruvate dehydrogenase complex